MSLLKSRSSMKPAKEDPSLRPMDKKMGIRLKVRDRPTFTTGIDILDGILWGGFHKDGIIHLFGDPGTGKTTFAMHLLTQVLQKGWRGIWIDCNGAFSLKRLQQMISDHQLLNQLVYVRINSFHHQTQVFQQLSNHLDRVGILVVDPLTHHYRVERYNEGSQGYFQLLMDQIGTLVGIAKFQQIPCIVVNYATLNQQRFQVPLVEGAFKNIERYRLLFYKQRSLIAEKQSTVTYELEIVLAPDKYAQRRRFSFQITPAGVTNFSIFEVNT